MKILLSKIPYYIRSRITNQHFLLVSLFSYLFSLFFSVIHYLGIYYGNPISWITWIIAVLTFSLAFLPAKARLRRTIKKSDLLIVLFITVLFFASHLINFSTAPWNSNGLFDDAAWDIYFAKNHVFSNIPFQPAFFDQVGFISREVVFHYYISTFFVLFGYNLLVFNISLLVLGFITVFFTTFIIHRLFKNITITILSAIIINFFPLHFMHIFMGHRYAIVAPLMMVSLYYLYTAFIDKSFFKASISAIFAALCFGSAIMGKQYFYGLALAAIFILLSGKKLGLKEKFSIEIVWFTGFLITATPLLIYILFNYSIYTLREKTLINEFILQYQQRGFNGLWPYIDQLRELFFAKHSFRRQFLPDFYIIPLSYYFLVIPGLFIAFLKKYYEIIFLATIPILGAFVSGSYDFRVLMAVPIWIIAMAYSLNLIFILFKRKKETLSLYRYFFLVIGLLIIFLGLIPSVKYIWKVSRNPNYLYLLPHKDVAVSRLVQDIVVASDNPTSQMKWNEFNRNVSIPSIKNDSFVCPFGAYAIMHLYLQKYDDKKILSFCNQGIQLLKTPTEILNDNIIAINSYIPANKDLKLVWEVSDKTSDIIKTFSVYSKYGSEKNYSGIVDGNYFSLYVLTIKKEFIGQFKKDIKKRFISYELVE